MIINVVICTYNRYDLLDQAIASVMAQSVSPTDYQVTIIDNSPDAARSREMSHRWRGASNLLWHHSPVAGLSRARNLGLEATTTPLVAFIDDDATAGEGWLSHFVAAFEQLGPRAHAIGGRVRLRFAGPRPAWLSDGMLSYLSACDLGEEIRFIRPEEWVVGANLCYRTAAVKQAGGFSVALGRVGGGAALMSNDETDVRNRITARGGLIGYCPSAEVEHLVVADRLRQSWFRKRIAWQAVSDYVGGQDAMQLGHADFVACLATLRGNVPSGTRIIVIDDCSTESALLDAVAGLAASGEIEVRRHPSNRGFPAAANTGIRFSASHGSRDILLLNCDTLLPPKAVSRLARAAYADARIGSVTPMTNDGTILSYPRINGGNEVPDLAEVVRLDAAFNLANGEQLVDIPTAIGFCMFIRHDCLAETGVFRDDVFAQGYGEENDWCLRASHLGWRHVAAAGVFVGHVGGQSFGAVKSHLIARNVKLLNQLHPGYDRLVADFIERDPLAPFRRAADIARWRERPVTGGAVVLITHDRGGGVERHVRERCEAILAEGRRPIVVYPGPDASTCRIMTGEKSEFDHLVFRLPDELSLLVSFLTEEAPRHVELHHLIGHRSEMLDLARGLGVALDVYIHDYAQWCPRVTLVSYGEKYCGEPTRIEDCVACVADLGSRLDDPIEVAPLRQRSAAMLLGARAVIVPSEDAAKRVRRHFPLVRPVVGKWEDDEALMAALATARPPAPTTAGGKTKIIVPGAIGYDKGYDVLLACARDAARRDLGIEFVVVGHTVDDGRLLDTGRIFVTGRYTEDEGPGLVGAQHAHLGFIPSVWPETWCYALSLLWRGGLRSVAFDIGAQAERIKRADAGWLIPIGLPPPTHKRLEPRCSRCWPGMRRLTTPSSHGWPTPPCVAAGRSDGSA